MPGIENVSEYLRLRRLYLEEEYGYLNDMQKKAVFATGNAVRRERQTDRDRS